MIKRALVAISVTFILAGCGYSRNIPKSWRPVTVEEKALKWAVKLCHQFGYTDQDTEKGMEARRKCIAQRYDQYMMENN